MSERKKCRVEKLEYEEMGSGTISMPAKILGRSDLILVAAGSLSCLRALYRQAYELGKTSQFYCCVISPEEYAAGKQEEILREMLQKALDRPGVGGVILYASCMETITRLEFERIKERLNNPDKIPVEVLFRGPMVARTQTPSKNLETILKKMPETGEAVSSEHRIAPVVQTDFAGLSDWLQNWDTYNFLINTGGCTGCMKIPPEEKDTYMLHKSRFNDLEISLGCEERAVEGIAEDYEKQLQSSRKKRLCCLLGAAVPRMVGFDYAQVEEELNQRGIPNLYLFSDGFHSVQEGLAEAYLTFGKKYITKKMEKIPGRLGILGEQGIYGRNQKKIEHGKEHLQWDGYELWIPEEQPLDAFGELGRASVNWVVSAMGLPLAVWLWENFRIPYVAGLPVGPRAMKFWREELARQSGQKLPEGHMPHKQEMTEMSSGMKSQRESEEKMRNLSGKRILLCGEAVIIRGLGRFLKEECNAEKVSYALYAPIRSMKTWYERTMQKGEISWIPGSEEEFRPCYFRNISEWEELKQNYDYVIADPIFGEDPKLIALPEHLLTDGLRREEIAYEVFGKKGSRWLEKVISERL